MAFLGLEHFEVVQVVAAVVVFAAAVAQQQAADHQLQRLTGVG